MVKRLVGSRSERSPVWLEFSQQWKGGIVVKQARTESGFYFKHWGRNLDWRVLHNLIYIFKMTFSSGWSLR